MRKAFHMTRTLLMMAEGCILLLIAGMNDVVAAPFTVADEIGLTFFGGGQANRESTMVAFSPDGAHVAVHTERGLLKENRVEDSLRFYRSADIEKYLAHPQGAALPAPEWSVTVATRDEGSIIKDWRWLPDSEGVSYVESMEEGRLRLVIADLKKRSVEPLTSEQEWLAPYAAYDIRDRRHYLYTRWWWERDRTRGVFCFHKREAAGFWPIEARTAPGR